MESEVKLFDSTQKPSSRSQDLAQHDERAPREETTEVTEEKYWSRELIPASSLSINSSNKRPKVTVEEIEELIEEHRRRRVERGERPSQEHPTSADSKVRSGASSADVSSRAVINNPLFKLERVNEEHPSYLSNTDEKKDVRASSTSTTTSRQSRFHRHISPHRTFSKNKYNFRCEFLVENGSESVQSSYTAVSNGMMHEKETERKRTTYNDHYEGQLRSNASSSLAAQEALLASPQKDTEHIQPKEVSSTDKWEIPVTDITGSLQVSAVTVANPMTTTHSRSPSTLATLELSSLGKTGMTQITPTPTVPTSTKNSFHVPELASSLPQQTPASATRTSLATPPPSPRLGAVHAGARPTGITSSHSHPGESNSLSKVPLTPRFALSAHSSPYRAGIGSSFDAHVSGGSMTLMSSDEEHRLSLALKAAAAQLEAIVADLKNESQYHSQHVSTITTEARISHPRASPAAVSSISSATLAAPTPTTTMSSSELPTSRVSNAAISNTLNTEPEKLHNRSTSNHSVSYAPSSIAWNVDALTSSFATTEAGGSRAPVEAKQGDHFAARYQSASSNDSKVGASIITNQVPSTAPPPPPPMNSKTEIHTSHFNSYSYKHAAQALMAADAATKGVHIIHPEPSREKAMDQSGEESSLFQSQQAKVQRLHQGTPTREPSPRRSASGQSLITSGPYKSSSTPHELYVRAPSALTYSSGQPLRHLLAKSPPKSSLAPTGVSIAMTTSTSQPTNGNQREIRHLLSNSPVRIDIGNGVFDSRANGFTVTSTRGASRTPQSSRDTSSLQRTRSGSNDRSYNRTASLLPNKTNDRSVSRGSFVYSVSPAADREASVNLSIATTNTHTGRAPFSIILWNGQYQHNDKKIKVVIGAGFIFLTQVTERAAKSLGCAPSPEILFTPMGHPITKISELKPDHHYLMLPAGCGYRADTVPVALLKRLVVAKDLVLMERGTSEAADNEFMV